MLQSSTGRRDLRATLASMSCRNFSLPTCQGEAEMFKMISAPAETSRAMGLER